MVTGLILMLMAQVANVPAASHAQLPYPLANYISPDDYPEAAIADRASGHVELSLGIQTDGRLCSCTVRRGSGSAILDAATCRILMRRVKFTPARNAAGEPIAESIDTSFDWRPPTPDMLRRLRRLRRR